MKKIKLGFLGTGYMGQLAHMHHYVQYPELCEIVSICDVKIEQAKALAQRWNIPKVTPDYRELLADREIDAVICIQQFQNHVVLVPDVLRAGKHVMTEKPLCVYPQNAQMLINVAKETGKMHMVGYHKRSDPAVEYAMGVIREWKQSGEMGKMTYVRLSMPPGDFRKDADTPLLTSEPPMHVPQEPGPAGITQATHDKTVWFVNYYIHQVNLMRYLLSEDYELTYADKHFFSAKSESGVNCILELEPYTTTVDWQEHALVCFEKGWIRIDLAAPLATQLASTVQIYKDKHWDSRFITPMMPNVCAMRNQAKNFLLALNGQKPAPCLSEEAIKDLRIAENYIRMTDGEFKAAYVKKGV